MEDLQPFVDLLPASGEMPFVDWKQAIADNGLRVGNRMFNRLRKRAIDLRIDDNDGLMVSRKVAE